MAYKASKSSMKKPMTNMLPEAKVTAKRKKKKSTVVRKKRKLVTSSGGIGKDMKKVKAARKRGTQTFKRK